MPLDDSLAGQPLAGIIARCGEETALYRAHRKHDSRYCLELFRRAFVAGDQRAWDAVYIRYAPQIRRWVLRQSATAEAEGELDAIVNGTFARFWRAIERLGFQFGSLAELLSYFQKCVGGEIIDRARRRERDALERTEELQPWVPEEGDEAASAHAAVVADACWAALTARARSEPERIYALAGLRLGFKPRHIAALYPHIFDGPADVNRVRANFVARLRRDLELKALCADLFDAP